MKRLIFLFVMLSSLSFGQFSPTYDSVKFRGNRGKIYELIQYPGNSSIKINGRVYTFTGAPIDTTHFLHQSDLAGLADSVWVDTTFVKTAALPASQWTTGTSGIYHNGKVGIGVTDVSSTDSMLNVAQGAKFGRDIVVNGVTVGQGRIVGSNNVVFGTEALASNITGGRNIAVGDYALNRNASGSYNSAIGFGALTQNTAGSSNTAIGNVALQNNSIKSWNTAIGGNSLNNNEGFSNTAVGISALYSNTTGHNLVAVGDSALYYGSSSIENTAVGSKALMGATPYGSGQGTTAIGYNAININRGSNNTGVGAFSLANNTIGNENVAIGYNAGRYAGIAASNNQTPTGGIYIGYDARASSDNRTNEIVIGKNSIGKGSNTTTIGNSSVTDTYLYGTINSDSIPNDASPDSVATVKNGKLYRALLPVSTTYTATLPIAVTGSVISSHKASASDSGYIDTTTYGKIQRAYGWGNHASAGYLVNPMTTTGAMIFNGIGGAERLEVGTSGQVLKSLGTPLIPTWADLTSQDSIKNPWLYLGGKTIQRGSETGSETGNVGINTSNPATRLEVNGASTLPTILGGSAVGSNITFQSTSGAGTTTAPAVTIKGGNNGLTTLATFNNDASTSFGTTTTGANVTVNPTHGNEMAPALTTGNWTFNASYWRYNTSPNTIEKFGTGTGTLIPTAATNIVANVKYRVVIVISAMSVSTASYTLGGVSGTSLSAAGTYTDDITASSTGKLIITPTSTALLTISSISIKEITDGDITVIGDINASSIKSTSGTPAMFITPSGNVIIGPTTTYNTAKLNIEGSFSQAGTTFAVSSSAGASFSSGGSTTVASFMSCSGTLSRASAQNMFNLTPTVAQGTTAGYTGINLDVTQTSLGSGYNALINLQVGGVSKFNVLHTGNVGIGTTAPLAKLHVAGTIQTGVVAKVTVDSVNAIRLEGNATVYDDISVGGSALGSGQNAPSLRTFVGTILRYAYAPSTANDVSYFDAQLNHTWMEGDTVHVHLHYSPESLPAAGDTAVFEFEYSWANIGDVFPTTTTIIKKLPLNGLAALSHNIIEIVEIPAPGKTLSSIIACRLQRMQNNASDTYNGATEYIFVHNVDFHIKINKMGSNAEWHN